MKKNLISAAIVIAAIGLIYLLAARDDRNRHANYRLKACEIIAIEGDSKSPNYYIRYRLNVDDIEVIGRETLYCGTSECLHGYRSLLIGKKLPVVYEFENPRNSEMLRDSVAFSEYKVQMSKEYVQVIRTIDSIDALRN
ncbi:MAG: hypothetical protein EOP50_15490 [Sphingobacteriales bacterium]|nr:MAG: hypothetical protein EOP50_15490 [Sphingobacteriales bacterium]